MKKSRLEPIRKLTGKKSEIVKLEAWRRSDRDTVAYILFTVSFLPMACLSNSEIGSNGNSRKATAIGAGARRQMKWQMQKFKLKMGVGDCKYLSDT